MKGYSLLQRCLAIPVVLGLIILTASTPLVAPAAVEASSAAEWTVPITVNATPEVVVELKLGVRDGATDLFDDGIDVKKPPPGMGADAWLETNDPIFTWLYEDYRGPANSTAPTIYWELHVQSERSPITISWDDTEIPVCSTVEIKLIDMILYTFPTTLDPGSYWFAIRVTPDITPPVITINGDNPMTVECGDAYVEPGATASDDCCITEEVIIGGDPVDTGTPGTYYVTYDVSDCAGNPAVQVIRTVYVVDTTAPTITLNGDNPMTVECGDTYVEPGATASDDCCITEEVIIGGDPVDTGTPGTYYVTYDVSDCEGNPADQVVRTVYVVDTTAPTITLNGDNPMTVECGDTYDEPGAIASDDCCLTEDVIIGGDTVDPNTPSTYYVTYDVSDCAGNPAVQVVRTVYVVDTTAPVITLIGDNPMTVECGDPYDEPGAIALDDCCITEDVIIGGDPVDPNTPGTYYVTYDVSDCAGNPADQVVRTVNVVDTTAPRITLIGDNPMTVECGDDYIEPGATASDTCCVTDPVTIGGDAVDTGTPGTYYVTYDVSDCEGNPAVQVVRTVYVVDTTAPRITLIGDNPMTVECGDTYVEPGATASDRCCITVPIIIGGDEVDTGTAGTYYVTYDISDCEGNPADQVVRTVYVVDTTAPTIILIGDNPMTVECGDDYIEPGATASDTCCVTDPVTIGGDAVDTGTPGTYYVTYDVSDCEGNPAVQVVRTVNVVDTTAPIITLNGDNPMTVEQYSTYIEPGATASDSCCISANVTIGGDVVDTDTIGTYNVTYDVSDCAGNPADQVVRTVYVNGDGDIIPPVITLNGDNPMTVECGDTYDEPGATATDETCITDPVTIGGDPVDTGTPGTYNVTYDVSDCAGNPADQVVRTVYVADTTAPIITLNGDNPMTVECCEPYVEPGATASDSCCITEDVIIGGDSVDTCIPGTYYVTYDVSDCAGNPAAQVVRTVYVVDITAPTITLNGDNPMTLECCEPYVEPGANATDDCCIIVPIIMGGDPVDTCTPGTYYVTYDISDCAGNPAVQVVRTVNVVDTTAPVITLIGDNPMTVECCNPYVEPGATASDSCCITEDVIIGGDSVDTCIPGTYYVTYDVSDCAGNPADQVVRTVYVVDTTAPTITLNGDNPMTVPHGDTYVEPDATASDTCCISANVTIGGDVVDTDTIGTYYVTYDVYDCAGNPAVQVTRTVYVGDVTPPTISRTPRFFFFVAREDGENPQSRTLTIYNFGAKGCAPLEWTVSAGANWTTLSPTSGTTMRTIPGDQVDVSVNISGMTAGMYFTWITIEAPGATNTPQQVPVILVVMQRVTFFPFGGSGFP